MERELHPQKLWLFELVAKLEHPSFLSLGGATFEGGVFAEVFSVVGAVVEWANYPCKSSARSWGLVR